MDHLTDRRIVQRHLDLEVQAQRHEAMWRDGSAVHMHPVCKGGLPHPFLRAVQLEGLRWRVFDLLKLPGVNVAELRVDLLRALARDRPGVLHFTLRAAYPTAGAFITATEAAQAVTWWHQADSASIAEAA
jgi:hypothetical protein